MTADEIGNEAFLMVNEPEYSIEINGMTMCARVRTCARAHPGDAA